MYSRIKKGMLFNLNTVFFVFLLSFGLIFYLVEQNVLIKTTVTVWGWGKTLICSFI